MCWVLVGYLKKWIMGAGGRQWDSRQAIFYCGTVGPKLRESIEVSGHLRKVLPHLVGRGSEKASQKKW